MKKKEAINHLNAVDAALPSACQEIGVSVSVATGVSVGINVALRALTFDDEIDPVEDAKSAILASAVGTMFLDMADHIHDMYEEEEEQRNNG